MIKASLISILIILITAQFCFCQQCNPKFTLENILQDRVIFRPQNQNGLITETFIYRYVRIFFSNTPAIILSPDTYDLTFFDQINFFVKPQVSRSYVNFTFTSENMRWVSFQVKFWLTSRTDLLVGSFAIQNIRSPQQKTYDLAIPDHFLPFINEKTIHLNFITGIKATSSSKSYEIEVKNSGKTLQGNIFKITVFSSSDTIISSIQINYAIFNFELSYFASGGGQINYKSIQGSQYKKIHGSFSPIIYLIYGLDKIRLKNSSKMGLLFNFDGDYVMQTLTRQNIQELGVVYLSIGQQPSNVCSCDAYIQTSQCSSECPPLSYPFVSYAKGGKTCLTCSAKLNETINEFNTGCICMQGLQRIGESCLPSTKIIQCLQQNTVLSNGVCICIAGTQKVGSKCTSICSPNSAYNETAAKCQCKFGYFNISGVCGVCAADRVYNSTFQACICPENQFINPTLNICQCIPTFYNVSGNCVQTCPQGYSPAGKTCVPTQNCSQNQVFQNGKCICVENTYIVNNTCTTCPNTTYYNSTSQTCINCMANCAICFNFSSCAQCKKQYVYNATSVSCQMNRTCTKINQILFNGECQCIEGTYRVGNDCTVCTSGTFYNLTSRTCLKCVQNCLTCINSISCTQCMSNTYFDSSYGYCVPNCGTNQTIVKSQCKCIEGTYRVNGICKVCSLGEFYDNATQSCFPCPSNCLQCLDPKSCLKCIPQYIFDNQVDKCVPSGCGTNETLVNNKCQCIQGTYRINGQCSICKTRQFYNSRQQLCGNCSDNCLNCTNQVTCTQCESYYKLINNECRFNLFDLKDGYPKFTQNSILTDFIFSEPQKISQITPQQLQKIVRIEFQNSSTSPSQILLQQNPRNMSQIRIIYGFCGQIPLLSYNIKYTFTDTNISTKQDIESVSYKVLEKGLSNLSQE